MNNFGIMSALLTYDLFHTEEQVIAFIHDINQDERNFGATEDVLSVIRLTNHRSE